MIRRSSAALAMLAIASASVGQVVGADVESAPPRRTMPTIDSRTGERVRHPSILARNRRRNLRRHRR